jgi:hypothetical protein
MDRCFRALAIFDVSQRNEYGARLDESESSVTYFTASSNCKHLTEAAGHGDLPAFADDPDVRVEAL